MLRTAIGKKYQDFSFETTDGIILPFDSKLPLLDNIYYVILYKTVNDRCHYIRGKTWCFFETTNK